MIQFLQCQPTKAHNSLELQNILMRQLLHFSGLTGLLSWSAELLVAGNDRKVSTGDNKKVKRMFHANVYSLMAGQWGSKCVKFEVLKYESNSNSVRLLVDFVVIKKKIVFSVVCVNHQNTLLSVCI